ncbi:MAG: hypothetical protein ACPGTP_04275, partial [Bacteroidia bacterium]
LEGITINPFYHKDDVKNNVIPTFENDTKICQSLFISDEKIHDCTLLSTYKTRSKYDWDWLKNSGTKTYNNLHLYEATSPSIYREVLKKKRVRNTEINNRSKYQ